jgi:hypothetical protein
MPVEWTVVAIADELPWRMTGVVGYAGCSPTSASCWHGRSVVVPPFR